MLCCFFFLCLSLLCLSCSLCLFVFVCLCLMLFLFALCLFVLFCYVVLLHGLFFVCSFFPRICCCATGTLPGVHCWHRKDHNRHFLQRLNGGYSIVRDGALSFFVDLMYMFLFVCLVFVCCLFFCCLLPLLLYVLFCVCCVCFLCVFFFFLHVNIVCCCAVFSCVCAYCFCLVVICLCMSLFVLFFFVLVCKHITHKTIHTTTRANTTNK